MKAEITSTLIKGCGTLISAEVCRTKAEEGDTDLQHSYVNYHVLKIW